jgi:hypothetical protein
MPEDLRDQGEIKKVEEDALNQYGATASHTTL